MVLPIGFFMPLPLPIMIPFMMWQSAAIAAGFGTMFQYSKRKISAMSNEEFNRLDPVALINQDLDNIISNIPSSFTKVQHLNSAVFKAMSDMLADAIQFLTQYISTGGPSLTAQPSATTSPQGVLIPGVPGFLTPAISLAQQEEARRLAESSPPLFTAPVVTPDPFIGPPAPALTQAQLLAKYANWQTYRSKGGLLTESRWRLARRGQTGGIPEVPSRTLKQGKTFHPAYFRQLKSLQNNRNALLKQQTALVASIKAVSNRIQKEIERGNANPRAKAKIALTIKSLQRLVLSKSQSLNKIRLQIKRVQQEMNDFSERFTPTR